QTKRTPEDVRSIIRVVEYSSRPRRAPGEGRGRAYGVGPLPQGRPRAQPARGLPCGRRRGPFIPPVLGLPPLLSEGRRMKTLLLPPPVDVRRRFEPVLRSRGHEVAVC